LKKLLLAIAALVLAACVAVFVMLRPPSPPASQVFVNGVVLTMDAHDSVAEAVAVEADRIVAVGTRAELESYIESAAVVHDLQGRTLLPGFVDAHGHFPGSGLGAIAVDLNSPPIGTTTDIEGVVAALQASAADRPEGEWILGIGYDDSLLAEKRHPSRDDLDRASETHPIFLMHVSGHMGVANSMALARAGIDESSEAPAGGVISRDASGRLTGLLEETAATPVRNLAMDFSIGDFLEMIEFASDEYASVGVTTAQSGGMFTEIM